MDWLSGVLTIIGYVLLTFFAWWVYVIYLIVYVIIVWLTADTGGSLPGTNANEFWYPDTTATNPVPVLFGTQFIRGPNIVWYGDVSAMPWRKCT